MKTLGKLFKEVMAFKGYFYGSMVTGILLSSASGYQAVLMRDLFDSVSSSNREKLMNVVGILLLVSLVVAVTRYYSNYLGQYLSDLVTMEIRQKLQSKLLRLNLSYHGAVEKGSGGLMSRVLNDVIMVQTGIHNLASLIREPVLFIVLFSWLLILDWQLTLVLILVAPIIAAFSRQIARSLQKYGHHAQNELEGITENIKETLDGVRVIQSYNLEKEQEKRFDEVAKRYLESRKKIVSRSQAASPITEYIATLIFSGLFLYSVSDFSKLTGLGEFMSYLTALLMLSKPVTKLQDTYVKLQVALVSADRIYDILESKDEVIEIENALEFPKDWREIEYKNVGFQFGDKWVLRNFNFKITKGEVVAFVGESGSGKSTAVNLLERFYDPSEGQITVDGVPIQNFSLNSLRSNIALVTQDVFLFNESVDYNIRTGDMASTKVSVESSSQAANAHGFIMAREDNYLARVGDRGALLSGGEKQRVSIARAFYKDAPILILDEATSALDSASEVEVQKGLESLMSGRTVFVIAHRLSTVVNADKILVLKDGEVIESGDHQQLLDKKGEYFRFRNIQST